VTATDDLSPERRFNEAMHELYGKIVRESGYTPTVFFRMIVQHGGLEAAHRLLKPDADFFSYGFEHLCKIRRDDLTMEALIVSLDYRDQILSTREIATANERLAAARQLYPPHSLRRQGNKHAYRLGPLQHLNSFQALPVRV
jgi:hypothetical protein